MGVLEMAIAAVHDFNVSVLLEVADTVLASPTSPEAACKGRSNNGPCRRVTA